MLFEQSRTGFTRQRRCLLARAGAVMMLSGYVEVPGADRVTVQEKVVEAVFTELVNYLRETRG